MEIDFENFDFNELRRRKIDYLNQKYKGKKRFPGKCREEFLTKEFRNELREKFSEYNKLFFNSQLDFLNLKIDYWDNFSSNRRISKNENGEFFYEMTISTINHKFTPENHKYFRNMCHFMIYIWCAINNLSSTDFHNKRRQINKQMKDYFRIQQKTDELECLLIDSFILQMRKNILNPNNQKYYFLTI